MEKKRSPEKSNLEEDTALGKKIKTSKIFIEKTMLLNTNIQLDSDNCKNYSEIKLQPTVENQSLPTKWPNDLPFDVMWKIKDLEEQILKMEKEKQENELRIHKMEKTIQEQEQTIKDKISDFQLQIQKLEQKCYDYENECKMLRNENYVQDEKIRLLENIQVEQRELSCGPVFHSYVVFKGTDIVVPCECVKDYFSTLPDEIILKIFRMLPRSITMPYCAPVCKLWNRLCCDSSLWKEVNLDQKIVKVSTIAKLIKCGVQHLSLHSARLEYQGTSLLNSLSTSENSRFSKLQYLDLSDTEIEVDTLQDLLSVCSQLKYLSLYYIFKIPIHDIICRHIAANKDLQELNLGSVLGFTSLGILDICRSCLKLESLSLTWTYLSEETIDIIASNLPASVTTLLLNGNKEIQDSHIQNIIERCPNITKLNVPCCFRLTSAIIDFIVAGLQNIQHLDISYNKHILPEKLFMLKDSKSLEELVIDHFEKDEDAVFLYNLRNVLPDVRIFCN